MKQKQKSEILSIIEQARQEKSTTLDLTAKELTEFPSEIFELSQLQSLDLKYTQLINIPPEISRLSQLQNLDLGFNKLINIPQEVFELSQLQYLDLVGNQLISIPPEISRLSQLQNLDLNFNKLSSVPREIFELSQLQYLDLCCNQLISIPPEISRLSQLKLLNLSHNQLSDIPPEISRLSQLQNLYLNFNRLSGIPPEIFELSQLRSLDFSSNRIKKLPHEITKFNEPIKLYNNPFESPPIEIVDQGRKAVRNYFDSIENKETMRIYETKLLVVGDEGVGKTTLVNALFDKNFVFNYNDNRTTQGIDIRQWKFPFEKEGQHEFTVNIWDFGGRESYHATHQFFLSCRSLYIFVWEARQEYYAPGFYYWLNVIKLLSDSSPVLVVMNKKDERERMLNEADLLQKFPNIVGFYKVSCANDEGIEEFRKKIKETIVKLPHVGDDLPKEWLNIREKMEKDKRNCIGYRDYVKICERSGMDEKQAEHLSRYFHDLTGILHFHDHPLLRNRVILKPEWGIHAVYDVLDTKSIQQNQGRFHIDQLKEIWNTDLYPPDKQLHLLELMKRFELAFQFEGRDEYLAPELLAENTPASITNPWHNYNNLKFMYEYEFMPKGILSRFIVRNYRLIEKEYFWKDGVILIKKNTRAIIVGDYCNRKISITIYGPYKKEMLAIIRNHIEHIHSTLNNPPVKEMLCCVCSECMKFKDPFYHDFAIIKKCKEKNIGSLLCQKSFSNVSIEDILMTALKKQ